MMVYAERIRKDPTRSVVYHEDGHLRERLNAVSAQEREFTLGHKLILLEMLAVLIWIIWGVTRKGYYIPEIASQFFVMGFGAGVIAIIFKLNGMTINGMASAFQSGVADLAGTAVVVGMAKGILLVLGGSDADSYSTLNTILYGLGTALHGVPAFIGAECMYLFQSLFNLVVTSNSGQAALTMPGRRVTPDFRSGLPAGSRIRGRFYAGIGKSDRCSGRGRYRMGKMGQIPD